MAIIITDECINCGACEPECPWQAIYEDQELPPAREADIALNAKCEQEEQSFMVASLARDEHGRILRKAPPAPNEIAANKRRNGV